MDAILIGVIVLLALPVLVTAISLVLIVKINYTLDTLFEEEDE